MKVHQKNLNVIRLIVQYGFLGYGVFFLGWSPLFIMFSLWLEGFVRLFFTSVLLLISKGKGRVKFFLGNTFTSLLFQFVHLIFLLIISGAAVKYDPFITNLSNTFLGKSFTDHEVTDSILTPQGISPVDLKGDILRILIVLAAGYLASTLQQWIELTKNNKEWKEINPQLSSTAKLHFLIMAMFLLLFFTQLQYPTVIALSLILVGFLIDLLMQKKGLKTIREQLELQEKEKNRRLTINN